MTEGKAVNKLAAAIRVALKGDVALEVRTKLNIPYACEIVTMQNDHLPNHIYLQRYQTDLAVIEKEGKRWKPRVIVEAKLKTINTHGPLAYSEKAAKHREIFPCLRYGFIVIHSDKPRHLPPLVYRYGRHFDFLCSVFLEEPTAFINRINEEIATSRNWEKVIYKNIPSPISHRLLLSKRHRLCDDA